MNCDSYNTFSDYGTHKFPLNNPLAYCMVSEVNLGFNQGSAAMGNLNKYSRECQLFMSQRCAENWDEFCELSSQAVGNGYQQFSQETTRLFENEPSNGFEYKGLNSGQILVRNTAKQKYVNTVMGQCSIEEMDFDPNVVATPSIRYWKSQNGGVCLPTYAVSDPKTIDQDPVMNKLLDEPKIALDVLVSIYVTLVRRGQLQSFSNTRLGLFFANNKHIFHL